MVKNNKKTNKNKLRLFNKILIKFNYSNNNIFLVKINLKILSIMIKILVAK
jgi:hypothetical protein